MAGDQAQQAEGAVAADVGGGLGAARTDRLQPPARDRRAGGLRLELAGHAARERHGEVRVLAGRHHLHAGRIIRMMNLQAHVAGRQRRDGEVAADVRHAAGDRGARGRHARLERVG